MHYISERGDFLIVIGWLKSNPKDGTTYEKIQLSDKIPHEKRR